MYFMYEIQHLCCFQKDPALVSRWWFFSRCLKDDEGPAKMKSHFTAKDLFNKTPILRSENYLLGPQTLCRGVLYRSVQRNAASSRQSLRLAEL